MLRLCRTAAIYSARVNLPFLKAGGKGSDFRAGIERAIGLGWLWLHESGTYLKFTPGTARHLIANPRGRVVLHISRTEQHMLEPSFW
jgi:hypothetical protein